MIHSKTFFNLGLALDGVSIKSHKTIVRFYANHKIMASLNAPEKRATVKLSVEQQDLFCLYDKAIMYPVPNKWGKLGWTHINLSLATKEMVKEALQEAWRTTMTLKPIKEKNN